MKDFEKSVVNYRRNQLRCSVGEAEKKRQMKDFLSIVDWALAVGRRAEVRDGYIYDLPLEDCLEWVALATGTVIIAEETKMIQSRMPAASPKTLAEALEVIAETYRFLWLRHNDFYLFYNPFRGIPVIDHTAMLKDR